MSLLCRLFGHAKTADRVRHHGGDVFTSKCRRCGADIARIGGGSWNTDDSVRVKGKRKRRSRAEGKHIDADSDES